MSVLVCRSVTWTFAAVMAELDVVTQEKQSRGVICLEEHKSKCPQGTASGSSHYVSQIRLSGSLDSACILVKSVALCCTVHEIRLNRCSLHA